MRRRVLASEFPAPLQVFREEDWPPVEGECLRHYACRDAGYAADCVSTGGPCGWRSYAMIERDHPDRPEMLARWKRADAYTRWKQARLDWLGKDHPRWFDEFLDSREHEIRYGKGRGDG